MRQVFSPRQVARAIGASESSIKRWCDRGVLPTIKTAGGHRRLPIAGILDFVRTENHQLAHPEILGLPSDLGNVPHSIEEAEQRFKQSLVQGDYAESRRLVLQLFLAQTPIGRMFDRVFAPTFHSMGEDWCDGNLEIFEERRGCELATRLIYELRSMMKLPGETAPSAMCASGEGDFYELPPRMVELVLVENGWNAAPLGSGIPFESMVRAVERHSPRLFCLSVSHIEDQTEFVKQYPRLREACGSKTALVVGGRALTEEIREQMEYTAYGENLQRLSSLVQAFHDPSSS